MPSPKILAINVALRPQSKAKIFPIGLSYVLSGLKRAGVEFSLLDIDRWRMPPEEVLAELGAEKWDIVLLGCIVTGYSIVKRLLADIRQVNPDALIVVGNSVASSIPDILLERTEADVAVIGEGDVTAVEVVQSWLARKDVSDVPGIVFKKDGAIRRTAPRPVIADINGILPPLYDIFDTEAYIEGHRNCVGEPLPRPREQIRAFPVNTARGCINRCTFCYHCFIGHKYRYRSAENIVGEMMDLRARHAINYFMLWDDLTFFSKKQITEFVETLEARQLDIAWFGAVRGNLFTEEADLPLLRRMRDAGCMYLGFALESANQDILKAMRKNVSLSDFAKQKRLFDKAGITAGTSIVLGYPQETPQTIAATYQYCLDLGIYPSTGYLLPQPGTPIYEWAKANGHIDDEEAYLLRMGDRQDLRLNLTTMSDQEFEDTVLHWLGILNRELELGLDEQALIKTTFKRSAKDGISH